MTTPTRLKLAAYGRVGNDTYTSERQAKDMRTWARMNRCTIVGDVQFNHGTSRHVTLKERPGLMHALNLVTSRRVHGVLVPTLHKLAAELVVQESALSVIWAYGGRIFAVDGGEIPEDNPDDPMRTFLRQMIGIVGELEEGLIAKHSKSACCPYDCASCHIRCGCPRSQEG